MLNGRANDAQADVNLKKTGAAQLAVLCVLCLSSLLLVSCSSLSGSQTAGSIPAANENVGVRVSPAEAEMKSASTLQLSASVTGTANTGVSWTTTVGTISSTGVFVAPKVSVPTTAIITATSASGFAIRIDSANPGSAPSTVPVPAKSGSAMVTIVPGNTQLEITSTALPPANVGVDYNASVSASGGETPYKWSAASGGLPAGLSINSSTGAITGTPGQAGTFPVSVSVTDSQQHTATWASHLIVSSGQNSGFDGPAELPRVYMQTAMADTPAPGKTIVVSAGGDLQSAMDSASCGDTIQLQAGATYSGLYKVPAKSCDAQHWIIVRTSAVSSLPPEGTRVTPCYAGVSSLPGRPSFNCSSPQNVLAKVVYNSVAGSGPIQFVGGANYYRFIGLEITRPTGTGYVGSLVMAESGVTADQLIFDRCWIHGTAQDETTTGVAMAGFTNTAVINSFMTDFHCTSKVGSCTDAHDIGGGTGSNPGGPYEISNNFLEASGENVLFGGGSATYTPADIHIAQNHFYKPMTWMSGQPGFVGGTGGNPFVVKNHLELKNAQRVLAENNIFENSWGGFSQDGFSILLTPKNQSQGSSNVCSICEVTDVTIRYSTISHVGAGLQICDVLSDSGGAALAGERYSIHDITIDDISASKYKGGGGFIEYGSGWTTTSLNSVTINHVTAFPDPTSHVISLYNLTTNPTMWGFTFTNNIVNVPKFPVWNGLGSKSSCSASDVPVTSLKACFTSYTFANNALANSPSAYPPSSWPADNFFPSSDTAIQFVNYNNGNGGNYALLPTSPYKNAGTDGKDLGADIAGIEAALAGVY